MAQTPAAFEQLAAGDSTVAPLARLQAMALEASEDRAWADSVPDPPATRPGPDAPLLEGATLTVGTDRVRRLWRRLVGMEPPEPLAILRAGITQDNAALAAMSEQTGLDQSVLTVYAHTLSLPLLLACGRRYADAVRTMGWSHGYCPVCAAWPTLGEVRGLARDFVMRCGRCSTEWPFEHRRCPFCGSQDDRTQGYFAPEKERESRRAMICEGCHGYLKTQTTLGRLDPPDLLLYDLRSVEMDVAALGHGYERPDVPGWSLSVQIEPAPRRAGLRRWLT